MCPSDERHPTLAAPASDIPVAGAAWPNARIGV